MRTIITVAGVAGLVLFPQLCRADWSETLKQYSCVEVDLFQKGDTEIDEDALGRIRQDIVREMDKEKVVPKVAAGSSCPGEALSVSGIVMHYKKGDFGKSLIPFQSRKGKSSLEAQTSIRVKGTGQILAEKLIVSKSVEIPVEKEKYVPVEHELAEKVVGFIKKGK